MRKLNEEKGVTVILITHYMEEVVFADRVFVMDNGKLVMQGTPREIFSEVEKLKELRLDVPQVTLLAYESVSYTHLVSADDILVSVRTEKSVERLTNQFGVQATTENEAVVAGSDLVFLSLIHICTVTSCLLMLKNVDMFAV